MEKPPLLKTSLAILPVSIATAYLANRYSVHDAFLNFYGKDVDIWNPITNFRALLGFANYDKFGEAGFNPAAFTFIGGFVPWAFGLGIYHTIFRKKDSDVHGSAKWATLSEVEKKFKLLKPMDEVIDGRAGIIIGAVEHPKGKEFVRVNPDDESKKYKLKLKPLMYHGASHMCLIAPTGGGKGVGIIVPNILNYAHSVVVNDMKGTEYERTAGYRANVLNNLVLKFEPANNDGSSIQFNPMDFIAVGTESEFLQAQKIALQFVDVKGEGIDPSDYFLVNGGKLLAAAMLHLLYTRKNNSPADVLTFLSGVDPETDEPYADVKEFLAEMCGGEYKPKKKKDAPPNPPRPSQQQNANSVTQSDETTQQEPKKPVHKRSHLEAYADLHGLTIPEAKAKLGNLVDSFGYVRTIKTVAQALFTKESEKEVSGVVGSATTGLSLFSSPIIAHNTKTSTINLRDLQNGEKATSLYIVVKKEYQQLLNPLIRILLSQIFEEIHRNDIKNIKRELTFFLDEFPQLGQIDDVATTMATIREFKARFLLVTQNLDFFEKYYGKEGAQVILGNCDVKICYPNGSKPTTDLIAEWVGYTTVTEVQKSKTVQKQGGLFGGSSVSIQTSQSVNKRHLIMSDEIAKMGEQTIIYVVGKGPIKGTAYKYFEDKEVLARINQPIPSQKYVPSVVKDPLPKAAPTSSDADATNEMELIKSQVKKTNFKELYSEKLKHYEEIHLAQKSKNVEEHLSKVKPRNLVKAAEDISKPINSDNNEE